MSQANSFERQMLDLINQERTSRGLDALQLELRLNDAAEDYSDLMLDNDFFSHTGPGGTDPGDRMEDAGFVFSGSWTWGENIAWQSERGATGISDDVANLHQALMNSSGHRANILNPNFELIGIGIERGDYRGYDAVMITQNFATTGASVQIDGGTGGNTPPLNPPPTGTNGRDNLVGTSGDDVIEGFDGNDTLTGNGGDDEMFGGWGNDQLSGNDGADTIHGGTGRDLLMGHNGADKIWGNAHDDEAYGGSGNDEIGGGSGNDSLWGEGNNDTIHGGDGDDQINGGSGDDRLWANSGNDTITAGDGNDQIGGGNGDDVIYAQDGNDTLYGGGGNDELWTGSGRDLVFGGDGNDRILGLDGSDVMNGERGNDTMTGGADDDRFIFSGGNDRITDFNAFSDGEDIDLSGVNAITGFGDLQANHLSSVNGNAVISDGWGNTLTLEGVAVSNLDAGDFLF